MPRTIDRPGLPTPRRLLFRGYRLRSPPDQPADPAELDLMITRELQNGRLTMIAAAGFLAQELVDGHGIFEPFRVSMIESADFGL